MLVVVVVSEAEISFHVLVFVPPVVLGFPYIGSKAAALSAAILS